MSYFKGKDSLLLQDYFDFKVKLKELKTKQRFWNAETEIDDEIKEVEKNIIEITSMFNISQLKQLIYMDLDIDYDKLVEQGIIR